MLKVKLGLIEEKLIKRSQTTIYVVKNLIAFIYFPLLIVIENFCKEIKNGILKKDIDMSDVKIC